MQIKSEITNTIVNKTVYWGRIIVLGIILGVSIQVVYAWTGPASAPPGGNVSGPLTVGAGVQTKAGKLQTASTVATDPATTLATKNYVDAAASTYIRGGQYGYCKQELNAAFAVTVAGPAYYPVTTCPGSGAATAEPTCASGFAVIRVFVSQMNASARGVSTDGHSRMDDTLDTYSRGTACVKL